MPDHRAETESILFTNSTGVERLRGRRSLAGFRRRKPAEGAVPGAVASIEIAQDRFAPGRLQPVKNRGRAGTRGEGSSVGKVREAISRLRPLSLLDWVLLAVEVAGAVVIAWLAFQYVYTVYFSASPHRVVTAVRTPVPSLLGGAAGKVPLPTPTHFAELLPPLEGSGPGTGVVEPTPMPTPTVEPALLLPSRLRVPVMFLDSPVHEVTVNLGKWEVSPMEVGHHEGTAGPGEKGNVVLAGHRDINSALFRELDRLKPGDDVFVSNALREYRYVVTDSFVVTPEHTEIMDPTADKRVTLLTCTPIGLATQRLVVTAILDETYKQP